MPKAPAEKMPQGANKQENNAEKAKAAIKVGQKFKVKDVVYKYAGVVEDVDSADNGKPVGESIGEKGLYETFSPEQLEMGILAEFADSVKEGGERSEKLNKRLGKFWEKNCVDNERNNPEKVSCPI
jgi:hypothetical protein